MRTVLVSAMLLLILVFGACGESTEKAAEPYLARLIKGESVGAVTSMAARASTKIEQYVQDHAEDAKALRDYVEDPETRKGACVTLDWIHQHGGSQNVTPAQIETFAAQYLTAVGAAESFADHASRLGTTNAVLALCDAGDLSEVG